MIAPAYNKKILDSFVPVFDQQSKIFVEKLKGHVGGEEFNVHDYLTLCSLDMVFGNTNWNCLLLKSNLFLFFLETAMGVSMKAQLDPNCQFANCVEEWVLYCLILICWLRINSKRRHNGNGFFFFLNLQYRIMDTLRKRLVYLWLRPDFIFERSAIGKLQKKCIEYVHNFTHKAIQAKRLQLDGTMGSNSTSE